MTAPKLSGLKTPKRPQPTRDDDDLTRRVRAALADVPGVTEKKKFKPPRFFKKHPGDRQDSGNPVTFLCARGIVHHATHS
jgi:hypothetical protein